MNSLADPYAAVPDYPEDEGSARGGWLRHLALLAGILLALLAGTTLVYSFVSGPGAKAPTVHQVSLIKQPPPPPPKPPEKAPEPQKLKDEVKVDQPKPDQPRPDEPKPADDKPASDKPLAVDADGAAGADGFGLAARRGGTDLLSTGGGGAYYSGLLQRQFFDALTRNRKILQDNFSVVVKVWVADDGRITRADVVNGSGVAEVDEMIRSTLMAIAPLREVPPASMRPMQLRLSNRS